MDLDRLMMQVRELVEFKARVEPMLAEYEAHKKREAKREAEWNDPHQRKHLAQEAHQLGADEVQGSRRPTIDELEALLKEENPNVKINPDGTVTTDAPGPMQFGEQLTPEQIAERDAAIAASQSAFTDTPGEQAPANPAA